MAGRHQRGALHSRRPCIGLLNVLRIARRGGAQALGGRHDADATEVEAVRIPAHLHRQFRAQPALAVAPY